MEKFYNKKYYNPEYHYYVDGGDVLRLYSERDNSKGEPTWTDVLDSYYYNVHFMPFRLFRLTSTIHYSIVGSFIHFSLNGLCIIHMRKLQSPLNLEVNML